MSEELGRKAKFDAAKEAAFKAAEAAMKKAGFRRHSLGLIVVADNIVGVSVEVEPTDFDVREFSRAARLAAAHVEKVARERRR